MEKAHDHLHGLDLLRFCAAVLVCLNHFATYARHGLDITPDASQRAFPMLSGFEGIGAVGVQVFFVISGFVIAFSASEKIGANGALKFAKSRFWRIVPTLWLSTLISFCALWISGIAMGDLFLRLVKSMFLFPIGPHIDGVVWTLMVEAVFYLLVGLSVWFLGRAPLFAIAMFLGSSSCLYLTVLLLAHLSGWANVLDALFRFPFTLFLFRHGVFFALGILLWLRRHGGRRSGLIWMLCFSAFAGVEIWFAMGLQIANFVLAIAICILFWGCLLASITRPQFRRYGRFVRSLGNLSYPLYLNHYALGICITGRLGGMGFSETQHLLVSLAAVLCVSFLVLRIEQTMRRVIYPRGIFRTMVRPPLT